MKPVDSKLLRLLITLVFWVAATKTAFAGYFYQGGPYNTAPSGCYTTYQEVYSNYWLGLWPVHNQYNGDTYSLISSTNSMNGVSYSWSTVASDGRYSCCGSYTDLWGSCTVLEGKNNGGQSCSNGVSSGNPINHGTGNKFQQETDYEGPFGLSFIRSYNLMPASNSSLSGSFDFGKNWSHTYKRAVTSLSSSVTIVYRSDGRSYSFSLNQSTWKPDADISDQLIELKDASGNRTGWKYVQVVDDSIELYDTNGKLVTATARNGQVQTLTYSDSLTPVSIAPKPGLLIRVTNYVGRTLDFQYDAQGRLVKVISPIGAYVYGYDEASSIVLSGNGLSNNLTSVTYPDGKKRIYWYNEQDKTANTNIPSALTGITDENGARYATYRYDSSKRAISTEHAGNVEKYTISYGAQYAQSIVTDPLGTQRTYNLQVVLGVVKGGGQNQPGGSGCGPASSAITYDANGNVASRTDFNGNQTTYGYDLTRNLEVSRVEGAGTAAARTITTEWHPSYRLITRQAEPLRITVNTYDPNGNLLSKSVQATSDATGTQGFAATAVGAARTWRYTYNNAGQVLSASGPRTDLNDTTSYAYDAQGNLVSVTNAAGQITTLSNYDANGRVGTITDPNGLVTTLTYSPRGWLTAKSVGGEVTTYDYDGAGQLVKVMQPDGAWINYTYDGAHRLITIADSLGNRISYTLDAMGNRISEQVRDPAGTLAQQTTRVYDALNRLQQITGGIQ